MDKTVFTPSHRIESNPGVNTPSNKSNRLEQATKLAHRLRDSNPDAVWFYYGILGKLDANTIDRFAVAALEKKAARPGAYFNRCVTNELAKGMRTA